MSNVLFSSVRFAPVTQWLGSALPMLGPARAPLRGFAAAISRNFNSLNPSLGILRSLRFSGKLALT